MWESMPPAVRMRCSPAITSVDAPMTISMSSMMSGFPAAPMALMTPSRMATSAL